MRNTPGNGAEQGGFASTVRANHGDDLARRERQREAVNRAGSPRGLRKRSSKSDPRSLFLSFATPRNDDKQHGNASNSRDYANRMTAAGDSSFPKTDAPIRMIPPTVALIGSAKR